MSLIKTETVALFDADRIKPGNLICARYKDWDGDRTGVVSEVSRNKVTVLYVTGAKAASNYYVIWAKEVAAGSWQVRWSSDLFTIKEWGDEL